MRLPRTFQLHAMTKGKRLALTKTPIGWTLLDDRGILAGTSSKPLLQ